MNLILVSPNSSLPTGRLFTATTRVLSFGSVLVDLLYAEEPIGMGLKGSAGISAINFVNSSPMAFARRSIPYDGKLAIRFSGVSSNSKWKSPHLIRRDPVILMKFFGEPELMGIVTSTDFHDAVDRPFRMSGIPTHFAGHLDFQVLDFINDFRFTVCKSIIEANCEIRPCVGSSCIFFHNI